MRRSAMFGTIASTLAAGTLLVVTSAGGSSAATTIRLYEHDTSQANLDIGDKGESAGDVFAFTGDTFKRKGGTKVGRATGTCTTTSTGSEGVVLCVVSFSLPGGQISTQGMFASADLFGGQKLSFPITGGTGRYRGARGQATVQIPQDVPELADAKFELRLR